MSSGIGSTKEEIITRVQRYQQTKLSDIQKLQSYSENFVTHYSEATIEILNKVPVNAKAIDLALVQETYESINALLESFAQNINEIIALKENDIGNVKKNPHATDAAHKQINYHSYVKAGVSDDIFKWSQAERQRSLEFIQNVENSFYRTLVEQFQFSKNELAKVPGVLSKINNSEKDATKLGLMTTIAMGRHAVIKRLKEAAESIRAMIAGQTQKIQQAISKTKVKEVSTEPVQIIDSRLQTELEQNGGATKKACNAQTLMGVDLSEIVPQSFLNQETAEIKLDETNRDLNLADNPQDGPLAIMAKELNTKLGVDAATPKMIKDLIARYKGSSNGNLIDTVLRHIKVKLLSLKLGCDFNTARTLNLRFMGNNRLDQYKKKGTPQNEQAKRRSTTPQGNQRKSRQSRAREFHGQWIEMQDGLKRALETIYSSHK